MPFDFTWPPLFECQRENISCTSHGDTIIWTVQSDTILYYTMRFYTTMYEPVPDTVLCYRVRICTTRLDSVQWDTILYYELRLWIKRSLYHETRFCTLSPTAHCSLQRRQETLEKSPTFSNATHQQWRIWSNSAGFSSNLAESSTIPLD